MRHLYYISLLCILLFALCWLFRKLLASHAMMLFFRILAVLGTLTGAIAWTISALGVWQVRNSFGDWGDNAVTSNANFTWPWILLFWIIYSFPMMAFLLMLFSALNLFRGGIRCIAYCYSLLILIIMAAFFWWVDSKFHSPPWRQICFAYIGFAVFWGYAFRQNGSRNWEATAPQPP